MIKTDLCIIGSGPVALFAVFEAGQLNMRCHLIDARQEAYKAYEDLQDKHLCNILMEKISIYKPSFSNGEWVKELIHEDDDQYILITNNDTKIYCKSLVFSAGYEEELSLGRIHTSDEFNVKFRLSEGF